MLLVFVKLYNTKFGINGKRQKLMILEYEE